MKHRLALVKQGRGSFKLHWLVQIEIELRQLELARYLLVTDGNPTIQLWCKSSLLLKLLVADLVNRYVVKHIHSALREGLVHHGSVMLLGKHLLLILLLRSFDCWKRVGCVPLHKATLIVISSVVDQRLLLMSHSGLKHQRSWLIVLLMWVWRASHCRLCAPVIAWNQLLLLLLVMLLNSLLRSNMGLHHTLLLL